MSEYCENCAALADELDDVRVVLDQCTRHKQGRGFALEEARGRIKALEAALHKIGYEPIGHAEATDSETLIAIVGIARAALETFVKPVKVHYSANDYEGLAVALADLLKQVNKFCEEQGEAEFYTGSALAALGQSDNEVHIKTLNDLRSQANRGVAK